MESGKHGWVQAHLFGCICRRLWVPKEQSKSCLAAVAWWHCNTSQVGFLHWAKIQGSAGKVLRWTMWRKPHTSSSNQLCTNTADLVVVWGLLVITHSQEGWIHPSTSEWAVEQSRYVAAWFAHKGSHIKQQTMGCTNLLLSSIPVVLLPHWVASCRPIGLSLNLHVGERKDFHGGTVCALPNLHFYCTF